MNCVRTYIIDSVSHVYFIAFKIYDLIAFNCRKEGSYKRRLYEVVRTTHERRVNDYNPEILYMWKGNMDIQFICESTAVLAHYIAKYQTKEPKSNFDEFHAEQMCDKSQFSKLLSLAMTLMKNREMGIMEASNYLLANSPYRTSERFQYLNCRFPCNRKKTLKSGKFLRDLPDDSKDIYFGNWITSWYPNRPDGLEELTLRDFASKYARTDKATANKRKDKSLLLTLKNNAGYMLKLQPTARYRHDTIVYGPALDPKKKAEDFYYSHIMLQVVGVEFRNIN